MGSNDGSNCNSEFSSEKYLQSLRMIDKSTCGTTSRNEVKRVTFVLNTGLCSHGPSALSM